MLSEVLNFRDNKTRLRNPYCDSKDSERTTNIYRSNRILNNLRRTVTLLGESTFTICFDFLEADLKLKNFCDVEYAKVLDGKGAIKESLKRKKLLLLMRAVSTFSSSAPSSFSSPSCRERNYAL